MDKPRLPEHFPVLIVDDHPVNRQVLGYLLDQIGLKHEEAATGEEAVAITRIKTFAAILMDVMMPVMDGYEATRLIRKAEFASGSHTPIIACTALDLDQAREKCLDSGMDDFLLKPISMDVLRNRLERWLQQPVAQLLTEFKTNLEYAAKNDDPINREKLRLLYGTDQLGDIMDIFIIATEALLIELKTGIRDRSPEQVGRAAHELKGSSFAVSAEEMAILARRLETASRSNNWAEALAIYAEMARAFASVRELVIKATKAA